MVQPGFARLESGDPDGGAAAYERALELGYQGPTVMYNLACCAARSGDLDRAFKWLDRAEKAGFEIGEYVGSDTDLDALRGDPRYDALLERWDHKMAKQHREVGRIGRWKRRTDTENLGLILGPSASALGPFLRSSPTKIEERALYLDSPSFQTRASTFHLHHASGGTRRVARASTAG